MQGKKKNLNQFFNDLKKISHFTITSMKGQIAVSCCYSYRRVPLKYLVTWTEAQGGKSGPDILRHMFSRRAKFISKLTLPLNKPQLNKEFQFKNCSSGDGEMEGWRQHFPHGCNCWNNGVLDLVFFSVSFHSPSCFIC